MAIITDLPYTLRSLLRLKSQVCQNKKILFVRGKIFPDIIDGSLGIDINLSLSIPSASPAITLTL